MIKAKFMVLDFINSVFELLIVSFFLFYIILGDRFELVVKLIQSFGPLFFFYLFFSFGFRLNRSRFKKFKRDSNLKEALIYLSPDDILKDRLVIFLLSVLIVLISFFASILNLTDFLQGVFIFVYLFTVHYVIFRSKGDSVVVTLNNYDKIKDQVAIYLSPFLIFVVGMTISAVDKMDFFQSIIVFLVMMLWHTRLFRKNYL